MNKFLIIPFHIQGRCKDDAAEKKDTAELGIDNVGGVFVVLAFGCLVAFIIAILEFLWNVRKVAVEERVSRVMVIAIL